MKLSDDEQRAELQWYFETHYPEASLARLPDLLTQVAMMQLGTAAGHEWPGTLVQDVEVDGNTITPSGATKRCAAYFGDISDEDRDFFWYPLLAYVAEGANLVMVDQGTEELAWGFGPGVDKLIDHPNAVLTPLDSFIQTPTFYRDLLDEAAKELKRR